MRRILALIAVLAVVLTACAGGSNTIVATVNGIDISMDDVRGLRPDTDSVGADQFASDLQLLIVNQVVRDGAAELGIVVTAEEIAADLAVIIEQIEAPDPSTGATLSFEDFMAQQNLSDAIVDLAIEQQVLNEELVAYFSESVEVTEEEIEAQFNIELQSRSEVCAAHILLDDEETANMVLDLALAEGADFGALAGEYSTGPTGPTGGVLGCASPANYVPEFAIATLEADLNVPYGPVQSEFGYHVLLVTQREVPVLEDIREELASTVRTAGANGAVTEWFVDLINSAVVTIDAKYGSWADSGSGVFGVVAPAPSA